MPIKLENGTVWIAVDEHVEFPISFVRPSANKSLLHLFQYSSGGVLLESSNHEGITSILRVIRAPVGTLIVGARFDPVREYSADVARLLWQYEDNLGELLALDLAGNNIFAIGEVPGFHGETDSLLVFNEQRSLVTNVTFPFEGRTRGYALEVQDGGVYVLGSA